MSTKFDSLFEDDEEQESQKQTLPSVGGRFDNLFESIDQNESINYNVAVDAALKSNPDQFAKTKETADQVGLPVDVAERNQEAVSHEARKKELDYQSLAKKNPILARQMSQLNFAKVAHDDVDALANIEQTAQFLDGKPKSFAPVRDIASGAGTALGMGLSGIGESLNILTRFIDREKKKIIGDRLYDESGGDTDNVLGEFFKFYGEGTKNVVDDYVASGSTTKTSQVIQGLGQVAGQVALVAFAPQAGVPMLFGQGVDITKDKIDSDPQAVLAPEAMQDAEMLVGGSITAATEFISSKLFLKAPASLQIRNKFLHYATQAGAGATNEAIQEATESLLQDVAHIAMTNPDAEISFEQALEEGEIAGYVGATMQVLINSALHIKARNTMSTFEQLNEASQAQKLRDRSPGDYQSYADAVAKHLADSSEGRVTDVYIDSQVFNQIVSEAGIQRDFINEQFPEIVDQLLEADQLGGGDIRLPMGKWIGKVAGTEIGDALTPHVRSNPDALSFSETEQAQQMQGDIQQRGEEIVSETVSNKQFKDSARAVESDVFEQIKSTAKYSDSVARNYASFVREFYVARAKEEGVSPQEIFDRYGLSVVSSDQIDERQVLSQAQESGFEGSNPIEATEWVSAANKGLDMSQEGRMQRARDMGFDVDQVVYHGTSADFESFDPDRSDSRRKTGTPHGAFVFSNSAENSATYADRNNNLDFIESYGEGGNVKPVFVRFENPLVMEVEGELTADRFFDFIQGKSQNNDTLAGHINDLASDAKSNGHDAFIVNGVVDSAGGYYTPQQTTFIFDPTNIRSINAAFDPDFSDSGNLLAQSAFHGTPHKFDKFSLDAIGTGEGAQAYGWGMYFAGKREVAWFPEQIKSAVGNNGDFDSNNASILKQETRGGFDPTTLTTILNEKSDYSTFLHESAHFFLEVYADLASNPNASDQIKADMSTLLEWFGEPDLESWNSKTLDERRKAHEQFAYNFEIYLFEGKAPSLELKKIFDRFSAWLRRIYRSIKEELNAAYRAENGTDLPVLTGEVREVMDRMLASEDQIEQAQLVRKAVPLYASQEQSGMGDDEWLAYESLRQEADDEAISDLSKATVSQMKWLGNAKSRVLKEMQKKTASIRNAVKDQVRQEILLEQPFSVMRYLRFGESLDDNGDVVESERTTKLDSGLVRQIYSDDSENAPDYKSLKYGKSGMLAKVGLDPDFVADMFGYPSGDAMIRALIDSPTIEQEVDARTDKRMMEENSDLIDDKSIQSAVNEALHTEARARFVAVELKHLSKATQPVRVMVKAARQAAESILSGKKIDDIKPSQYVSAEARAAKEVLTAMRQGDPQRVTEAKQRELLNNQLASEAIKIQSEVGKITDKFKRLQKKSAQSKMRGEFLEQLNNLLARFDLRTSTTKKQRTEERLPLAEFVKNEADRLSAVAPDLPSWVLADDYKKHYKELSVDELRDLSDSVSQLEVLAKREEKMYQAVRDQTYQQEVGSILDELKAVHPEAFDDQGEPIQYRKDRLPFVKDKRMRLRSKFDAEFLNMENLLDVMSAGKGKQIFDSIFGRLSKAADDRNEYMKKVGTKISEATRAYTTKERLEMTFKKEKVGRTDRYMTREERISVGLYYGMADGRQRLADGNELTDFEINEIINSLDEKDVEVLKAFWSTSDNIIWPDLESLNKRTAGISVKKTEAAPFNTRFGVVSGGYVPLVYDGDLDSRALDLNTNASVQDLLGGTSGTAATQRSASKARIDVVKRPLDLSLRAMAFKLNETVHDITHREAVADTYRLLQSKRFSSAIRTIAGPDVYKALVSRVREVAVKPRVPSGFSEKAFWYLRKNTLVSLMGASFNTVAINVLGVAPSIRRVGSVRFLKALAKFPYHMGPIHKGNKYHDMVIEKSQYMKNRLEGFDRDLNEELSRVLGKQGIMPTLGFWFAGLSAMDRMITMPTWLAAYEKGMDLHKNDDSAAVEYADRVIRQTQGSGRPVDLAQIAGGVGTAGEFKRIITMFYNFFSSQLGSLRRGGAVAGRKWKSGERAQAASQLTLDALMVVVVPATLEAMARGQCGDDPDASDYLYCAGRSSALFAGAFFPIFRDVLPYTWKQFDPEIKSFRVAISPIESALETVARLPKSAYDLSSGDGNEADLRTLVRSFGYLFGLPGSQAWRTLDGFRKLSDGESGDPTIILTGPRE